MTAVGPAPQNLRGGRVGAEAEGYPGAPKLGFGGWGLQNPDCLPWSGIVGSGPGLGRSVFLAAQGTVARSSPAAVGDGSKASLLYPLVYSPNLPFPHLSSHMPRLSRESGNHPGRESIEELPG